MPKCSFCSSESISHTIVSPKGKSFMCAYCYTKQALINLKERMLDAIDLSDLDASNLRKARYALEQVDIYEP